MVCESQALLPENSWARSQHLENVTGFCGWKPHFQSSEQSRIKPVNTEPSVLWRLRVTGANRLSSTSQPVRRKLLPWHNTVPSPGMWYWDLHRTLLWRSVERGHRLCHRAGVLRALWQGRANGKRTWEDPQANFILLRMAVCGIIWSRDISDQNTQGLSQRRQITTLSWWWGLAGGKMAISSPRLTGAVPGTWRVWCASWS